MSNSHVLLFEGKTDRHAIGSLLTFHGLPREFELIDEEGLPNLKSALPIYLKGSEVKCIGVVVDADENIGACWQSLSDILVAHGYPSVPIAPDPAGTIVRGPEMPVVGIWVMPDNILEGTLETFASFLIAAGDPLWGLACNAVESIPVAERRFPTIRTIKAQIHTWLAWQEWPGLSIGTAITTRYLDATLPNATSLISWINRLRA